MTRRRRRSKKNPLLAALLTLMLVGVLVLAEPVLADYGISVNELLSGTDITIPTGDFTHTDIPAGPAEGTLEVRFLDVGQGSH